MSSNDTLQLQLQQSVQDDVRDIVQFQLGPLLLETILFAFFTILIVASTRTILSQPIRHSRSRQVLLGATLAMYTTSATMFALSTALVLRTLLTILPETLEPGFIPVHEASIVVYSDWDSVPLRMAMVICYGTNIMLGDAIVLWRACAIWGSPRWLRILCTLILLMTFVFYLVALCTEQSDILPEGPISASDSAHIESGFWGQLSAFALSATAFTNVFATGMIGYKTWLHWHSVVALMRQTSAMTKQTFSILAILVETGVAYSILWLLTLFGTQGFLGPYLAAYLPFSMYQISGIYPTIVLVLVAAAGKRSVLEEGISPSPHPRNDAIQNRTLSIQFADGVSRSASTSMTISDEEDEERCDSRAGEDPVMVIERAHARCEGDVEKGGEV